MTISEIRAFWETESLLDRSAAEKDAILITAKLHVDYFTEVVDTMVEHFQDLEQKTRDYNGIAPQAAAARLREINQALSRVLNTVQHL